MLYNNTIQIKRDVLYRTAKVLLSGNLDDLNRIPLEAAPRGKENIRCCIHKDRAILKYRIMAALGYAIEDETDELRSLSSYGENIPDLISPDLTVINDACSSCSLGGYYISDFCVGCVARSCSKICPKGAITIVNGKSIIDNKKCINCGKCETVCPFNAVVKISVPCVSSCPVNALEKNEEGIAVIDKDKCISCGKCIKSCPFGAITDKSQLPVVIKKLKSHKVNALIAPSIVGQFPGEISQIIEVIKDLGYSDVIHVGNFAAEVARKEAKEFLEREDVMTSSCCPAFTLCVEKHAPVMKPYISDTASPMILCGSNLKKKDPECINVFIGPCFAKKVEASKSGEIDYVLTYEELGAHIMALGKEVLAYKESNVDIKKSGYGFAKSGGVAQGVVNKLRDEGVWITPDTQNGIDSKVVKKFKVFNKLDKTYDFLEVMACEGGCISGPGTIVPQKVSSNKLNSLIK